jgi:hypothetical protein
MEGDGNNTDDLNEARIFEIMLSAHRDAFVESFRTPKARVEASILFDEYVIAGGNLNPEHLELIRKIVLETYPEESSREEPIRKGQLMVRRRIGLVKVEGETSSLPKRKVEPLPKRGIATADTITAEDSETAEEEYMLVAFSESLKPAPVPTRIEGRNQSGMIIRWADIDASGDRKRQA